MQSLWSECSNEDFRNYYALITANNGNFCLKQASTSVSERPQTEATSVSQNLCTRGDGSIDLDCVKLVLGFGQTSENAKTPKDFSENYNPHGYPQVLEAELDIYISPSWRIQFGTNYKTKIIKIIKQVAQMFKSQTLKTKIDITKVRLTDVSYELKPVPKDVKSFKAILSGKANLKRSINLLLTWDGKFSNSIGLSGISTSLDLCKDEPSVSICRYFIDDLNTAQSVAHELGHIIGMFHDFDVPYDIPQARFRAGWRSDFLRKTTCGPPEDETGHDNYLMNYGTPMQSLWSECSNEDFRNYYDNVVANDGNFCLKVPQIKFNTIYGFV
jgi:hypothetical protein